MKLFLIGSGYNIQIGLKRYVLLSAPSHMTADSKISKQCGSKPVFISDLKNLLENFKLCYCNAMFTVWPKVCGNMTIAPICGSSPNKVIVSFYWN